LHGRPLSGNFPIVRLILIAVVVGVLPCLLPAFILAALFVSFLVQVLFEQVSLRLALFVGLIALHHDGRKLLNLEQVSLPLDSQLFVIEGGLEHVCFRGADAEAGVYFFLLLLLGEIAFLDLQMVSRVDVPVDYQNIIKCKTN